MSFVDEMRNLRTALDQTNQKTKAAVKKTKKDADNLCRDTQAMMRGVRETQKANAKKLRGELKSATIQLEKDVREMREDNLGKQRQLRQELAQGSRIFWGKAKSKEAVKEKEEGE